MRASVAVLGLAVLFSLGGCEKAGQAVSEKAAGKAVEKAVEQALQQDGTRAKVDIAEGSVRMTTTDAAGKTSEYQMGAADVTEKDVGVPFYPGAKALDGQSSRLVTPDGSTVSIGLRSSDAPAKVAAFYRDHLKAQAPGKQFVEMSGGDGNTMLALNDEKGESAVQVVIDKSDAETQIQIVAQRRTSK
ncbi:MAG: hypothetical protein KJZ98_05940 [Burkholderiaceae bacterium]|jgi:hypothetical protein|nr:hypothetical protein [Burkholderiaceae bacterium]MEB2349925.1 hypothetical protein [Burkholderiaceae bacterium]